MSNHVHGIVQITGEVDIGTVHYDIVPLIELREELAEVKKKSKKQIDSSTKWLGLWRGVCEL